MTALLTLDNVSRKFGGLSAVDGVSLTVNAVDGARFEVNLIPQTRAATTFRSLVPGMHVNLEIDMQQNGTGFLSDVRG